MNLKLTLVSLICGGLMVFGCGPRDANVKSPQTLQEQRDLMNGHFQPPPDQLAKAMGDVHIPKPGEKGSPRLPDKGAPPAPKR